MLRVQSRRRTSVRTAIEGGLNETCSDQGVEIQALRDACRWGRLPGTELVQSTDQTRWSRNGKKGSSRPGSPKFGLLRPAPVEPTPKVLGCRG